MWPWVGFSDEKDDAHKPAGPGAGSSRPRGASAGRAERPIAMRRADAVRVLHALHAAQNDFYAGGEGHSTLCEMLCDDVRWTVPGVNAIAGTYVGVDAVLAYFTRRRALADNTMRLHRRDVLVGTGPAIATLTDGEAVIAKRPCTWSTVGLYHLRDARVSACWLLPLDQAAFDGIWSLVKAGEDSVDFH